MKNSLLFIVVFSFFINSCKEEKSATKSTTLENSHYYSFKDGLLYGYEQKPNSDGSENPLIMFQYAGQRDDVYQLFYSQDNHVVNVVECKKPCEFMKNKTYYNTEGGNVISKNYFRVSDKTIAKLAILDAINGNLEQSVVVKNGKNYSVWFGQRVELTMIK